MTRKQMEKELKRIRQNSGMTYGQMAVRLRVSRVSVARWCTQGIKNMHLATKMSVTRFIEDYRKAEDSGGLEKFLEGPPI